MSDLFVMIILIIGVIVGLTYWGDDQSFREGSINLGRDVKAIVHEINQPIESEKR